MTIPLPSLTSSQVDAVDAWLRSVLWENELPGQSKKSPQFEIHRLKGRLVMNDGSQKMIQGVRELFDIMDNPSADSFEGVIGKVILIGRHLGDFDFQKSLLNAIEKQ
jgi:hypothetical protein